MKKEAFLEIMDCAKDGDDDMTLDDLDDDNPDFHLSGDDYIDVMRFLEESLAREKMEERGQHSVDGSANANERFFFAERAEEQELEEMEACEEEMCRVMAQLHTEDDYVPCPVCKRNKLGQLMGVIYCSCGLRINVQVLFPWDLQRCHLVLGFSERLNQTGLRERPTGPVFSAAQVELVFSCLEGDFILPQMHWEKEE